MTPVAAICDFHGAFESKEFCYRGQSVRLSNNTDVCPRKGCQRPSRVMDGEFSFDKYGFATILDAPETSRAALDAVQASYVKAVAQLEQSSEGEVPGMLDALYESNSSNARHGAPRERALISVINRHVYREANREIVKEPSKKKRKFTLKGLFYAAAAVLSAYPGGQAIVNDLGPVVDRVAVWASQEFESNQSPAIDDLPQEMLPKSWKAVEPSQKIRRKGRR